VAGLDPTIHAVEQGSRQIAREPPVTLAHRPDRAGSQVAHFDRVHWTVIPDAATAAAAMQKNEADWWEQPVFDLLPILARAPNLVVRT
jgi:ABC-type transport system substrate-binding protein